MEYWISTATLLSEDLESILKEIQELNLASDHTIARKKSAFYLSKFFTSEQRISWGPKASKILVFYATSITPNNDDIAQFLGASPDKWLERINQFRKANPRRSQVTRDCVYQLFKMDVLSITDIAQRLNMLAHLAHRMKVHEYMALRIDGMSPVSFCLRMSDHKAVVDRTVRLNFFKSLHQAFKSDFTHIIGLQEFIKLVNGGFSDLIKFFDHINAKFQPLDFALSCLTNRDSVNFYVPRKPFWATKATPLIKVIGEAIEDMSRNNRIGYSDLVMLSLSSYSHLIDLAYKKTFSFREFEGSGSEFPLHDLPAEIIEHIITIDNEMKDSIRPLLCVSRQLSAIKGKIKWQNYFKRINPLKHKIIKESVALRGSDFDWTEYYLNLNRFEGNWSSGHYTEIDWVGYPIDIKEEIVLYQIGWNPNCTTHTIQWHHCGEISSQAPKECYYWIRLADLDNLDEPLNAHCIIDIKGLFGVRIIDSNPLKPRFAVATKGNFQLYEGTQRIATSTYEPGQQPFSTPDILCRGDRVFIGPSEIIMDDRLTNKKIFEGRESVVDMNLLNGLRISRGNFDNYCLLSKDNEILNGNLMPNDNAQTTTAAFLDEFRIVACRQKNEDAAHVAFVDIRKLGEISDSFGVHEFVHFDPLNRRAIGKSFYGVVNLYDLDSKRLQNAVKTSGPSFDETLINSRFWCHRRFLWDFGGSN